MDIGILIDKTLFATKLVAHSCLFICSIESDPSMEKLVVDTLEDETEQVEADHNNKENVQLDKVLKSWCQEEIFSEKHNHQVLCEQNYVKQCLSEQC